MKSTFLTEKKNFKTEGFFNTVRRDKNMRLGHLFLWSE